MKLSRKQKTIRNFLLAALLLFFWWVLTGMHAFTAGQALKWEAQQRGLKETPQILYRSPKEGYTRRVLFAADGQVGFAQTEQAFLQAAAGIYKIAPQERTVIFGTERLDTVYLLVYTQVPNAARAECTVTLRGIVNNNKIHDAIYSMTAEANENGVFAFTMERKGMPGEETVFWDFANFLRDGRGDWDSRHTVALTFYDSTGNVLETYEKTFERT